MLIYFREGDPGKETPLQHTAGTPRAPQTQDIQDGTSQLLAKIEEPMPDVQIEKRNSSASIRLGKNQLRIYKKMPDGIRYQIGKAEPIVLDFTDFNDLAKKLNPILTQVFGKKGKDLTGALRLIFDDLQLKGKTPPPKTPPKAPEKPKEKPKEKPAASAIPYENTPLGDYPMPPAPNLPQSYTTVQSYNSGKLGHGRDKCLAWVQAAFDITYGMGESTRIGLRETSYSGTLNFDRLDAAVYRFDNGVPSPGNPQAYDMRKAPRRGAIIHVDERHRGSHIMFSLGNNRIAQQHGKQFRIVTWEQVLTERKANGEKRWQIRTLVFPGRSFVEKPQETVEFHQQFGEKFGDYYTDKLDGISGFIAEELGIPHDPKKQPNYISSVQEHIYQLNKPLFERFADSKGLIGLRLKKSGTRVRIPREWTTKKWD